ncbi:DUF4827 domain-containing protein [Bacteroidia bacterium]|nr:DUF4827 domain-containing protein [Bacteroidia bacterium]
MKKTFIYTFSLIATAFATVACDSSKTLQEYIEEERNAINRYISMQNITVLTTYPAEDLVETVFADTTAFFRTSDGLYFRVNKQGNGTKVTYMKEVIMRFDYLYYVKSFVSSEGADTISGQYFTNYYYPMEFRYGNAYSYAKNSYDLSCNGWAVPLSYVTEGAVIDIIIPSSLGTSSDNSAFNAVFYKNLQYSKFY